MKVLFLFSLSVLVLASTSASALPGNPLLELNYIQDFQKQQQADTKTLLGHVIKLINLIIDQAVKATDKVQQDAGTVLDDLLEQGEELVEFATGEVEKIVQDALNEMNSQQQLGVEECLEEVPVKLEQIAKDAVANAKACFENLFERVKILRQNVKEHVDFFVGKVRELQGVTQSCVDASPSVFEQIQCLFDHIPETNQMVGDILKDVGSLLAETVQESISLFNDTRGCLLDVVKQARNDVDKVLQEFLECVQQNQA